MSVAASAHMLPKGEATLNIKGDKGYLVVSIAASGLAGVDDNNDGLLEPAEIDRHRLHIQQQFRDGFSIRSAEKLLPLEFVWVTHPDNGEHEQAPSNYIIVLAGVQFSEPSEAVTVKSMLYGNNVDERQTILTVTRGAERQNATLSPEQPSRQFFIAAPGGSRWIILPGLLILAVMSVTLVSLRLRAVKPAP